MSDWFLIDRQKKKKKIWNINILGYFISIRFISIKLIHKLYIFTIYIYGIDK